MKTAFILLFLYILLVPIISAQELENYFNVTFINVVNTNCQTSNNWSYIDDMIIIKSLRQVGIQCTDLSYIFDNPGCEWRNIFSETDVCINKTLIGLLENSCYEDYPRENIKLILEANTKYYSRNVPYRREIMLGSLYVDKNSLENDCKYSKEKKYGSWIFLAAIFVLILGILDVYESTKKKKGIIRPIVCLLFAVILFIIDYVFK